MHAFPDTHVFLGLWQPVSLVKYVSQSTLRVTSGLDSESNIVRLSDAGQCEKGPKNTQEHRVA